MVTYPGNMKMIDRSEVLSEIEKVIDWYSKNYKKAQIPELMDCKSKLCTLLYTYTDEVVEAKKDSLFCTIYRKYHSHKMKSELIEKKFTVSLAESKSVVQTFEDMKGEGETEGLAYLTKLKLDQANRISDDIMQRISVLTKERSYSNSI